jgi:hypothetical protein
MHQLLKSIHLRRLHWAITSASLLNHPVSTGYFRDAGHKQTVLEILLALDSEIELVDSYFAKLCSLPMGKYFEQLIFFLIARDNRLELILSNQQIKEGNRTIGELDLIIKDTQTKKVEHWEICLKYYLQRNPSTDSRLMIGPNSMDNLSRKSAKLLNHQLPLSKHASLKYITGAYNVECKLFMKGQLYYHLNDNSMIAEDVNRHHETGWWCFLSETEAMLNSDLKWAKLTKPDWIGLHNESNQTSLLSNNEMTEILRAQIASETNTVLVVGMKEHENGWIEDTRGFIVHNNWPNQGPQVG